MAPPVHDSAVASFRPARRCCASTASAKDAKETGDIGGLRGPDAGIEHGGRIKPGDDIVHHHAPTAGQVVLRPARGPDLGDVEETEQQESGEKVPRVVGRGEDERQPLPGDFVDDDLAGIRLFGGRAIARRGPDAEQQYAGRRQEQRQSSIRRRYLQDRDSDRQRHERAERARRGRKRAGAEERGDEAYVQRNGGHRYVSGSSTVATAWPAMPSPRPVKPSFSVVVAFTLTRFASSPAISAIRAIIAAWCGRMRGS